MQKIEILENFLKSEVYKDYINYLNYEKQRLLIDAFNESLDDISRVRRLNEIKILNNLENIFELILQEYKGENNE